MSALPDSSTMDDQFEEQDANSGPIGQNGEAGSDDEDDVQSGTRRRKAAEVPEDEDDNEDDLFGDEEDAEPEAQPAKRQLDDAELDSGDDEGREDRLQQEEGETYEERELLSTDMEIPRQAVPEPSDGEMYLLKVPDFLAIEPQAWQTTTYQPPTTDHKSKKPASSSFSAFNTATTTIRWRHSPNNPADLQSNARINRWSDGSLTLQLASNPNVQYEIDANSLAPPQRNPIKPTPTAINNAGRKGVNGPEEKYDHNQDSFTYLMTPVENADAIRVARKITTALVLRQTDSGEDDAIEQLQAALASAANATRVGGAAGLLEVTDIDPEAQRKEAEAAERQLLRDRKKRENAQERERLRTDRALGRTGQSSGRYGGLNVGMLEDEETGGGRGRSNPNKSRAKPRRRRNSEYSEDEEEGGRRFNREDSYDQDDDFLAPSDEEEEVVEDDDDPDDGIVEEAREKTPKRDRPRPSMPAETSGIDEEEDAEGESDDMPQARTKRRRIVDDDDEE